jgi:MGT family glycosyltransferase
VPEWIGTLERPLVYVTLGTVFNQHRALFLRIAEALAGEDVDVVMTVGRNVDPAALGPLPANVHAARYIPQSLLLDRAAAVVTHGGFNTVMAALTFGVPVCCIPLSTDHPINAQRCVELGVGTACTTWTPPGGWPVARPEDVAPEAIRDNVRAVLDDPGYRVAAHRLRDEIAELPGTDEAVRRIERLVSSPRELVS